MRDKLKKFRGKECCPRCNAICDNEQALQEHRKEMHCEYPKRDELAKQKKLHIHMGRYPQRDDWITKLTTGQTYIWDCWDGCYYQYRKGIGLIDDVDMVIADENSDYFKEPMKVINRKTGVSDIKPQPQKPKPYSVPPNKPIKIAKKYMKEFKQCGYCNSLIRIIGPQSTNLIICPDCNRNLYERKETETIKTTKSKSKQVQQKTS